MARPDGDDDVTEITRWRDLSRHFTDYKSYIVFARVAWDNLRFHFVCLSIADRFDDILCISLLTGVS